MRGFPEREHERAPMRLGHALRGGFTEAWPFAATASEHRVKCRLFWASPTLDRRPKNNEVLRCGHPGAAMTMTGALSLGNGGSSLARQLVEDLDPAHSMSRLARSRSDGGMVRPKTFAVLRLMISSNFVG